MQISSQDTLAQTSHQDTSALYAELHDAKARLFHEGRVCVEPALACELRAEIGRLTQAIRKAEQESTRGGL